MLAADDAVVLLVQLVVSVVFGGICSAIAASRGRSALGWFFVGLLTNCIGLVLVLVLPDLKRQEAQMRMQQMENRRLREQLAKERQVADQRHGHVERRLGAHDRALDIDTSAPPELVENVANPPPLPDLTHWFYARGRERLGPVTEQILRDMLGSREISAETLLWREGMADWQPLGKTNEFRADSA
ncbi:MAG TPA: DUF4339 domain-containing protein [Planctomycetota bacterium]|nr:DUF4339 domain-containing protein [Planctomycetota bacterium]